jgi:hypothetical protein
MVKTGKVTPIFIVRWWLDIIVFVGGTMIALLVILRLGLHLFGVNTYISQSEWPVKIIFGQHNAIPLSIIDSHKPADGQILIQAIPTSASLQLISPMNFVLIGFDIVWMLLTYGTVLLIAYLMRKIFLQMESNNFFDPMTPVRLRLIGWTMIAASLMKSLFTYLYGLYATSIVAAVPSTMKATVLNPVGKPESIVLGPLVHISFDQLLIGTVILALAIAFQKGLDLKQEQSLTV